MSISKRTMNFKNILFALFVLGTSFCATAQRNVTPVETDDKKPQQPTLHYFDKHGKPLDEPVLFISDTDTLKRVSSKPIYPRFNSLSVGINIWDAAMKIAGQSYTGVDIWTNLSIHNMLFPTLELGVGMANKQSERNFYHYKGKPSFYTKVGIDYNFLYKSNSDYQLFIGLRVGMSSFGFEITDIYINSDYWQQQNIFSITDQHSTAIWGEALAGIKVKIWKNFSMGWTFRYKGMFKCTDGKMASPGYIPGFGGRNSKIGATFSFIYTIPFTQKSSKQTIKRENE